MRKINSECEYCIYNARHYAIVCALHPSGVNSKKCPDFKQDPELEGKNLKDFLGVGEPLEINGSINNPYYPESDMNWSPPGTDYVNGELVMKESYYNGELIKQPQQRFSKEEMLYLIDTHPLFTNICPNCNYEFEKQDSPRAHYNCPECGWDDSDIQPTRMQSQ